MIFSITGQIRAIKDCWIVGNLFINDIYYALAETNRDQVKSQQSKLYICDNYNVKCYSSNPLAKVNKAPARLVNSLINALHNYDGRPKKTEVPQKADQDPQFAPHLPRFIIVVPDWDIIKNIEYYRYGITMIAEKVMKWVVTNMNRAIETR